LARSRISLLSVLWEGPFFRDLVSISRKNPACPEILSEILAQQYLVRRSFAKTSQALVNWFHRVCSYVISTLYPS
jgi:hypothetical protein